MDLFNKRSLGRRTCNGSGTVDQDISFELKRREVIFERERARQIKSELKEAKDEVTACKQLIEELSEKHNEQLADKREAQKDLRLFKESQAQACKRYAQMEKKVEELESADFGAVKKSEFDKLQEELQEVKQSRDKAQKLVAAM